MHISIINHQIIVHDGVVFVDAAARAVRALEVAQPNDVLAVKKILLQSKEVVRKKKIELTL